MISLRTFCLALAALSAGAAGRAAAQVNINIGVGGHPRWVNPYSHIGTVGWYRPPPPIYRPRSLGVVVSPPVYQPVPPMFGLRPTIYSPTYLSLFAPGFQTIVANNVPYYFYPTLPAGATFVQVGGAPYFKAGALWYQPYATATGTVYLVVPPPV